MRVCGVEFKGNDAVISILEDNKGLFNILDVRVARVAVENAEDAEAMQKFQFSFKKLMQDYQVDKVIIRARPMRGKFAGAAVGFKLEAAVQLCTDLDVELIQPTEIKALSKRNPLPIDFKETGLKVFQEAAFTVAYLYLMQNS
ncbi:DUF3010 family protein [Algibacillus agarilyticus]|uniref:DUF3010 family protein n=1 Tax=Algibacillus agarilyticus TaxID=2234133 RepID=UPI000DD0EAEF|nr:DUF3010 family protein [Algibacillus agarilyticus]